MMRWEEHINAWGDEKWVQNLVGKREAKRPLGKSRRRCEDNIKKDRTSNERVWTGLIWLRILIGGGLW
jgi:hypothetical protein